MKSVSSIIILSLFFFISCVGNQKPEEQAKISEDKLGLFLQPYKIKLNSSIYQLTGINQENRIGILNSKGEIALLQFDEKMRPKEKVIVKGFPGYIEEDLQLLSDPEHRYIWLRRGNGVYFTDPDSGETGHVISIHPGSKIFQVCLVNPNQKKWWIVYGVSRYSIDEFNLNTNKKNTLDITIDGEIWPFGNNRLLYHSANFPKSYDWKFVDKNLNPFNFNIQNSLIQKMNNIPSLGLSYKRKAYNFTNKIMIGYTTNPPLYYSITWDITEKGEEDNVAINPFSDFQQPGYLQGISGARQFSSDGKWFDTSARLKSDKTNGPDVRLVYYVDRRFPAGVSPPIRLGSPYSLAGDEITGLMGGTFMHHRTWGPCYVMQNGLDSLYIFKLIQALEIIDKLQSQ